LESEVSWDSVQLSTVVEGGQDSLKLVQTRTVRENSEVNRWKLIEISSTKRANGTPPESGALRKYDEIALSLFQVDSFNFFGRKQIKCKTKTSTQTSAQHCRNTRK
jgi:hypothetical protein